MKLINEILSSISVLLVFLTILVTYLSTELNAILEEAKPVKERKTEREKFFKRLRFILIIKSLPITLIFLLVTYTLLPTTIEILQTSKLSLWDFDSLKTIFVIVELGLVGFTIYSFIQTIRLVKKLTTG
jgi:hypothetical protein